MKIFNRPNCKIFDFSEKIAPQITSTLHDIKPMIDSYAKSKDCFISIMPRDKDVLAVEANFKKGKVKRKLELVDINKIDENTPFARAIFEAVDKIADPTGKYVKPIRKFINSTIKNLNFINKI